MTHHEEMTAIMCIRDEIGNDKPITDYFNTHFKDLFHSDKVYITNINKEIMKYSNFVSEIITHSIQRRQKKPRAKSAPTSTSRKKYNIPSTSNHSSTNISRKKSRANSAPERKKPALLEKRMPPSVIRNIKKFLNLSSKQPNNV
jgi:hypothetical protein